MKVALVHDDLVQWGGAERVLVGLCKIFPDAPVYTSVYDDKNPIIAQNFSQKKIITSFMQKIPGWRSLYKSLLPFYPIAFEQFVFDEFDLVISNTTRFAKSIITKPKTFHVCYCHTPPRFLWNFSGEKTTKLLALYMSYLRIYDQLSSSRVDKFLAGSKNAQNRIKKIYKRDSSLLYPFVSLTKNTGTTPFSGDYYLVVSRLNSYKRVDIAVDVFSQRKTGLKKVRLKIVGIGPEANKLKFRAGPNIEFLGAVSEEILENLILGCKGLVITAEEDFGLGALEANALGKGVVAYGVGGSRESIIEGKTGVFFNTASPQSLDEAIDRFENLNIDSLECQKNAQNFSFEKFKDNLKKEISSLKD